MNRDLMGRIFNYVIVGAVLFAVVNLAYIAFVKLGLISGIRSSLYWMINMVVCVCELITYFALDKKERLRKHWILISSLFFFVVLIFFTTPFLLKNSKVLFTPILIVYICYILTYRPKDE